MFEQAAPGGGGGEESLYTPLLHIWLVDLGNIVYCKALGIPWSNMTSKILHYYQYGSL